MMGLGSAIGAGLFVGSGVGISIAGPAVIVSYAVAGLIAVLIMWMLGEMTAAMPSSGSFSAHAEAGIGRWAGFTVGWLYWATIIMVLGVEITGASVIVHGWLTGVPQWVIALTFVTIFAVVNLSGVRKFGELEFWFASIKVVAIIGFLAVGVALIFGWLPDTDPVGLSMIRSEGFAPAGLAGIASALLVVVFAFGGIEIITIAAAESADPARSVARATRSIVWRILVFYLGSVAVMVLVMPWDSPELLAAPFESVLDKAGLPAAATVMSVVVVIALLSAFNANVYGTSRMAFSLAERGDGPGAFLTVDRRGVPYRSVWISVIAAVIAVGLNAYLPDQILGILLNAVGATLLIVWFIVVVSHLRLRPKLPSATLKLRVRWYPFTDWFALTLLAGLAILMMFDGEARVQLLSALAFAALIAGIYWLTQRRSLRVR